MQNRLRHFLARKGWWLACSSAAVMTLIGAAPDPGSLTVRTPDWRQEDRAVWHRGVGDISFHLQSIRENALAAVADKRLSIEKHLSALHIVEQFSPRYTAKELIKSITIEDRRTHTYADFPRGRYPVVTVLSEYGTAVNVYVRSALARETDPLRRTLLCDVLELTSGVKQACLDLENYSQKKDRPESEQQCLQAAIAELQGRKIGAQQRNSRVQ